MTDARHGTPGVGQIDIDGEALDEQGAMRARLLRQGDEDRTARVRYEDAMADARALALDADALGFAGAEIAALLDVNRMTVWRWLNR